MKARAVAALNHPGGNVTAKRLQLLHELVPNVAVVRPS